MVTPLRDTALLLALVACCPPPGVRVANPDRSPPGTAEIVASFVASHPQARGEVTWVEGPMQACGAVTYPRGVAGCTWVGGRCASFNAYVVEAPTAAESALLHELRHGAGDDAGMR